MPAPEWKVQYIRYGTLAGLKRTIAGKLGFHRCLHVACYPLALPCSATSFYHTPAATLSPTSRNGQRSGAARR